MYYQTMIFFNPDIWSNYKFSEETNELVARLQNKTISSDELIKLNRNLLDIAYPKYLAQSKLNGNNLANRISQLNILLYQGGFAKHRGLDILIEAGSMLPQNWILVLMGWGSYEEHLRKLANDLDSLPQKIYFLPKVPQEELLNWTASATLGIIPYENVCMNHWYCTPNKLWEYPKALVPFLASPFPEMKKIVESGDIGWLLNDPITPEKIVQLIESINEEELIKKKENCKKFISNDNWNVYAKRLTKLYSSF
jgi:glycosyltransferase involved in cell wall biosynthesis